MKVRSGGSKVLNEHLAPLRRYLAGQVGRPWDKIFADVCRYLDRNSAVQDHVRDHLDDYVATRVMVCGGQLYCAGSYGKFRPLYNLFYVCPRTGILKKNPGYRRDFSRPERLHLHFLGGGTALVRKDGAWFLIATQKFPDRVWVRGIGHAPAVHIQRWDALLRTNLYRDQALHLYGRSIHAVTTRRPSKRELRRIVNSYPYTNLVR
jgi:hypothetical protein